MIPKIHCLLDVGGGTITIIVDTVEKRHENVCISFSTCIFLPDNDSCSDPHSYSIGGCKNLRSIIYLKRDPIKYMHDTSDLAMQLCIATLHGMWGWDMLYLYRLTI